jgi:hypothetical protein
MVSNMEIENNTDYTFNFGLSEDANNLTLDIWVFDSNKTQIYSVSGNTRYESGRKIIYNDIHIDGMSDAKYITIQVKRTINNTDTYGTFKPTLEKGNVDTFYDDYVEPITTNIYLNEPLRKIGDYADYIDFDNKRVVRNIKQAVLNGSEKWAYVKDYESTNIIRLYAENLFKKDLSNNDINVLSPMFKGDTWTRHYYGRDESVATYNGDARCGLNININRIGVSSNDTTKNKITALENYLSENNIIIYGVQETAYEEIELPNIPTFKGTTILEVDTKIQPSNMEVVYKGKEVK